MKKIFVILFVVVFSMPSIEAFSSTIAVVNLGKVMTNCKAGKEAKAQIDSLIAAKKVIINRKIEEIKKIAKVLQKKNLSKSQKQKETTLYESKIRDLQQYKADAASEIRAKENTLSGKIINDIIKIIKHYAIAHKIDAVLETGRGINVVYWNDKLDITKAITSLYDKQYSSKK